VFLTRSVPPHSLVIQEGPDTNTRILSKKSREKKSGDFNI